jgi:pyruvate dehydrogenase E1 component alpha subunit
LKKKTLILYLQTIDQEIRSVVDDATKKAKAEKEIPLEELTADIYSLPLENQVRNIGPFDPLSHKRIGKAVNFK